MRLTGSMSEQDPGQTKREGTEVFVIAYDEEGNELRLSPAEAAEATDRSRHLGIGLGSLAILRIKHGPFVAAETEIRLANIGSLAAALEGNYLGSALYVDRSAPPIDDDLLELDERYFLDVRDGQLAAVITQRYPNQPPESLSEIADSLARVVQAYGCSIDDVSFTLASGGTPEEFLQPFADDESYYAVRFNAENLETLAGLAHDVHIRVSTDHTKKINDLIDGATALADFLKATKDGPLHAEGVVNLLRAGHFKVLIGEAESEYLEVKTAMHPIWVAGATGEKAKIELAQDVARFANGDVDAVLVVGYKEAPGGGSKIASLTPVANSYINPAQINEVLDARIVPPLNGLAVEAFATSPTESILAIYVPKQPAEMQPYLVHGAIAEGKIEGAFFSIVRRRGEGSITTSAQQIHAYIVAGKRYLRGEEGT